MTPSLIPPILVSVGFVNLYWLYHKLMQLVGLVSGFAKGEIVVLAIIIIIRYIYIFLLA